MIETISNLLSVGTSMSLFHSEQPSVTQNGTAVLQHNYEQGDMKSTTRSIAQLFSTTAFLCSEYKVDLTVVRIHIRYNHPGVFSGM